MAKTRLYLVRHGEALDDEGLSPLGRSQAARLGRRLRTVPVAAIHHRPRARAQPNAFSVGGHLPDVPRHACDFVADRTPFPGDRAGYPERWHSWLDGVPSDERDEDSTALRKAVEHFGVTGDEDRQELLITHN